MGADPRDPGPPDDETAVDERRVVERDRYGDREVVEQRRRRRPPLIWPWLLLLLLLVAAGIGIWAYFAYADEDTKPVPDVVGQTVDQAVADLQAEDFKADIQRENDDAQVGTVFRQDPSAGTEAEEGSTVAIAVSEGPATEPVPQVEGLSEADARERLTEAGFEVNAVEVFSEEEDGTVVAQNPAADTEAERGSTVRINVSKGPGEVTVPDVVGRTEAEAKAELQEVGLRANVDMVPSEEPEGTVVAQNPTSGTTARADSLVRLNVSSGPA